MRQSKVLKAISITLSLSLLPCVGFSTPKISISQALMDCADLGNRLSSIPIQSELKKQTSLIGMVYLNYLYQNDIKNPHFCDSMLLMNFQVPVGTSNPYLHLFDAEMASKTMSVLEDIQLSFDYSIGRTNQSVEKVQSSVARIQSMLKKNS